MRIAVDDFGTGYSSLAYLRQFPVDSLKIDRTFITGLGRSREAHALTHTLIQLGKALGLKTLAEGVEESEQVRALQREGCDLAQGFLFARPMGARRARGVPGEQRSARARNAERDHKRSSERLGAALAPRSSARIGAIEVPVTRDRAEAHPGLLGVITRVLARDHVEAGDRALASLVIAVQQVDAERSAGLDHLAHGRVELVARGRASPPARS